MAQDLSTVFQVGRLTRDPAVVSLPSGDELTEFSIAVNQGTYTDKNGSKVERPAQFFDYVAYNGTGKTVATYLGKGRRVAIQGVPRQETWEDKNGGGKRSRVRFVALSVQFLDSPNQNGNGNQTAPAPELAVAPAAAPDVAAGVGDDDIPF